MAGLEAHYSARDIEGRILAAVRAAGDLLPKTWTSDVLVFDKRILQDVIDKKL